MAVAVLKLVAGVRGFYPARICDEITWNRVANLKGGAGNNLALDLVNEFLNNEFKGTKLYIVTSKAVIVPLLTPIGLFCDDFRVICHMLIFEC